MSALTAPRPTSTPAPAPARRRERRHLRVVRDEPRRHPVVYLALALVLATLIVMGAVSLNALAAGDAVRVRELSAAVEVAERTHGLLVAEVASLEDPDRIREQARKAGMVPASDPRFLEPGRPLPSDVAPVGPTRDALKPLLSADGR